MENKFKVALDSDILRVLVYFCDLTKNGNVFRYKNPTNIREEHLKQNFEDYTYLFNAIKSGKVKLIISRYVYNEVHYSQKCVDFINKYCYKNFYTDINKVELLAQAYTNPYIYKKQEMQAPMISKYVAAIDKEVPTNDCYIMADATVNNCNLVTNNLQDFIFDKSLADTNNHRRVDGIKIINTQLGYKKNLLNNQEFIPQPITLKKFIKMLIKHLEISKNNSSDQTQINNNSL